MKTMNRRGVLSSWLLVLGYWLQQRTKHKERGTILFLFLLLIPTLASASGVSLCSWDTPTTCIITCATYTPPCPVSEPTVTTLNCDPITGYRFHAGTSSGVYTVSSDVTVTNSSPLSTVVSTLPRGYICYVVTALTYAAESDYSNEKCFWNLGNYAYSDNATRPVPKKPTVPGTGVDVADNFNRNDVSPICGQLDHGPRRRRDADQLQQAPGDRDLQHDLLECEYVLEHPVFASDDGGHGRDLWRPGGQGKHDAAQLLLFQSRQYRHVVRIRESGERDLVRNWGRTSRATPHAAMCLRSAHLGSTLTGYVNGAVNATRTDTDLPSGRAGVGIYGTVTHLDNWYGWDGVYK